MNSSRVSKNEPSIIIWRARYEARRGPSERRFPASEGSGGGTEPGPAERRGVPERRRSRRERSGVSSRSLPREGGGGRGTKHAGGRASGGFRQAKAPAEERSRGRSADGAGASEGACRPRSGRAARHPIDQQTPSLERGAPASYQSADAPVQADQRSLIRRWASIRRCCGRRCDPLHPRSW